MEIMSAMYTISPISAINNVDAPKMTIIISKVDIGSPPFMGLHQPLLIKLTKKIWACPCPKLYYSTNP